MDTTLDTSIKKRIETVAFEHKESNENSWLPSSIRKMKFYGLPRRIKESRLGSV